MYPTDSTSTVGNSPSNLAVLINSCGNYNPSDPRSSQIEYDKNVDDTLLGHDIIKMFIRNDATEYTNDCCVYRLQREGDEYTLSRE